MLVDAVFDFLFAVVQLDKEELKAAVISMVNPAEKLSVVCEATARPSSVLCHYSDRFRVRNV